MPTDTYPEPDRRQPLRLPRLGLSGKLLMLTILFVMIAEVLIYVPSIANFRLNWLRDRLAVAHTAALVLDTSPSENVAREVLGSIGAKAVAMKMGHERRLLSFSEMPPTLHQDIDMRDISTWRAIMDAFETLFFSRDDDAIRVVGPAPKGGEFIELVIEEGPLRQAMLRFSRNVLLLSLIISAISAALVYLALHYMFVRPMRRLTANMVAFRNDPENPARIVVAWGGGRGRGV
jgi:hypothetical protein